MSDSDSEGGGFESHRAGQKVTASIKDAVTFCLLWDNEPVFAEQKSGSSKRRFLQSKNRVESRTSKNFGNRNSGRNLTKCRVSPDTASIKDAVTFCLPRDNEPVFAEQKSGSSKRRFL